MTRLAKELGVDKGTVSKIVNHGQGAPGLILRFSLKAGIAPPESLVGANQHRLIDGLYRLLAVAEQRFRGDPKKVAAAVEMAISDFEDHIEEHRTRGGSSGPLSSGPERAA